MPILSTSNPVDVTPTGAVTGGDITNDGGASILSRGVVWNTSPEPTISNSKLDEGSGSGTFTADLSGLTPSTQYYIRAYATNSQGTAYGNQLMLTTTAISAPLLTTNMISGITTTSASSGGTIVSDGGEAITAKGVCWSTSHNPTTADNKTTDGTGAGTFSSSIGGLLINTTYYVRAYATNSIGTGYGNELSFTTSSGQATYNISISNYAFSPSTITVPAGSTIKWTNNDAAPHTVTSDNSLFDSGTIATNGTYSRTFATTGTFTYHCAIHTYMTATVIVN